MKPSTAEIQVKDLNHYGIIAGIIDQIGLVEKINEMVGTHYRQKVTVDISALKLGFIATTRCPLNSPEIQKIKKIFKRKYNVKLIIKNGEIIHKV